MPRTRCGVLLSAPFLLLLAACTPGAPVNASTAGTAGGSGTAEACRMRGAAAEDRYAGPIGDLSIDSALVRSQVTQACLNGGG